MNKYDYIEEENDDLPINIQLKKLVSKMDTALTFTQNTGC